MNKKLQRAGLVLAFGLCGTMSSYTVQAASVSDVHAFDAFAPKPEVPASFTARATVSEGEEDSVAMNGPSTIDIDKYNFVTIPLKVVKQAGTLILSDSPEYVSGTGVLASGTVNGDGRIYFYHVNDQPEPRRIAIVAENQGKGEDVVTVKRFIETVPSPEYFEVGRDLSRQDLMIKPGLDLGNEGFSKTVLLPGQKAIETKNKAGRDRAKDEAMPTFSQGHRNKEGGSFAASYQKFQEKIKSILGIGPKGNPGDHNVGYKVQDPKSYSLWSGVKKEIVEELGKTTIHHEDLYSGMVDVHTTEPTKFSVLMIPKGDDGLTASYMLPSLPIDDSYLRGQFPAYTRQLEATISYNTDLGPAAINLANNRDDLFLKGVDPLTDNLAVENKGNYGVSNKIRIHVEGKSRFALYFNPLGGAYAGTVAITSNEGRTLIDVPRRRLPYLGHKTIYDTQYLGTFDGGQNIDIEFMSAGASNLPVRFLFVPEGLLT